MLYIQLIPVMPIFAVSVNSWYFIPTNVSVLILHPFCSLIYKWNHPSAELRARSQHKHCFALQPAIAATGDSAAKTPVPAITAMGAAILSPGPASVSQDSPGSTASRVSLPFVSKGNLEKQGAGICPPRSRLLGFSRVRCCHWFGSQTSYFQASMAVLNLRI